MTENNAGFQNNYQMLSDFVILKVMFYRYNSTLLIFHLFKFSLGKLGESIVSNSHNNLFRKIPKKYFSTVFFF